MWFRNVKGFGFILIMIGCLVGLNRFGVLPFERHWLALIVIIPSLIDMVIKKMNRLNTIGLGVGSVFFLIRQFGFSVAMISPIVLVLIGFVFIFIPSRRELIEKNESKACSYLNKN